METIGLIGGLTWHSTVDYYRLLNEEVNKKLGGYHAAKIFMCSEDFAEIKPLTEAEDWDALAAIMIHAAKTIENAGGCCVMIGANTMHKIADQVQDAVSIPVIHIAEAVAASVKQKQLKKVALLGTKYTMKLDFYKNKLAEHHIETIIPAEEDIDFINHSIYNEFSKGLFLPQTKKRYLDIIDELVKQGAEGIIAGCTEIPILIKQEDCSVPVFDTTYLHVMAAIDHATK